MNNDGIRLQKYLSECSVCSRRKAEELITNGKVKINGHPAILGDKVCYRDIVTVSGKRVARPDGGRIYIMLNKPRGYVTTMNDEMGRKCVADLVTDAPGRVYPCGRLDRDSEGMLILTSDGDFANTLSHPSRHVSKTYRVTVKPPVTVEMLDTMRTGIVLDGKKTAPCEIYVASDEETRVVLLMTLHEGRNREIRRMCEEVGLEVARLKRTAIGDLKLGMLPTGKWRELTEKEIRGLLSGAKAPNADDSAAAPRRRR